MTVLPGVVPPFTRSDIEQTIPARFEVVARACPGRIALTGDGRAWSYGALDTEANRLAHAVLSRVADGPGRICYLLPQSPEMVLATLAILKAGKTYTALHPGLPPSAQAELLRDAVPDLLLTNAACEPAALAAAAGVCPVLRIEDAAAVRESTRPPRHVGPADPSTLFYTSGSTGRPKGVVKSHRAVLHRVWLSTQHDRVTPDDRQSLLTHGAFSASESDIFAALLQGATVCTFDIARRGLDEFRAWLEDERVTLLHPPALYFRRLLSTLDGDGLFPHVRIVALAGDVVLPADLARWRRHFSSACAVLHRFSITETALLSVARIAHDDQPSGPVVEAGRPVDDKTLTLVDPEGRPVPVGDVGELLVTSAYLADGYWKRPEETAAAFSEAAGAPGLRTYRTGDLGRFEPDGTFVFLGRRDYQVKIRGFRVDTREIESALLVLDGVHEVAVVPRREHGEQRLHAFIVWATGTERSAEEVRAWLRTQVPAWKIPDGVHVVSALPTTFTGKVDRRALELAIPEPTRTPAPPSGPTADTGGRPREEAVAEVFAGVLGVPRVPVTADFLASGGNSLLVAELQVALQQRFGRAVQLQSLLQAPTVAAITALLAEAPEAGSPPDPTLVPLRSQGGGAQLFLVHGASGLPPTTPQLLDALSVHADLVGFRARGLSGDDPPATTIDEMARHYLRAMRRRQPTGPYLLGGICAGSLVALEMARQLQADGDQLGPIVLIDPPLPPQLRAPWRTLPRRLVAHLLWHAPDRPVVSGLSRWLSSPHGRTGAEFRVWLAFRRAAFAYPLVPFEGPVHLIGSESRLSDDDLARWRRCLTGPVQRVIVGAGHRDVLERLTADAASRIQRALAAVAVQAG